MHKTMLFGVAVAAMASAGCGQGRVEDGGPTVQRSYEVGSFQEIEVAGPYDVDVRTGGRPSVSATGSQKLIENMVVEVKGDKLVIHPQEHHGWFNWGTSTNGSAKLSVTVPSLSGATIAGSGGITVDQVKGDRFEGGVAGSGDLNVNALDVQSLKLSIGGSGDVRARSGQAKQAEYSIAGSGGIDAGGVRTQAATASIAGSGSIHAQATGAANIKIMGSGDVTMTGGAKCNVSKMGSGDVSCS
jgi:hypothetical protein